MAATKFKVGDKVRIIRKRVWADTGFADGWDQGETFFAGRTGYVRHIDEDGAHHVHPEMGPETSVPNGYFGMFDESELSPLVKTMDTLQAGDILIDEDGDERPIYAVIGDILAMDDGDPNDKAFNWKHIDTIKTRGWTIKDAEPDTTELSIAQLEEKLNIPAGTLRVKKN